MTARIAMTIAHADRVARDRELDRTTETTSKRSFFDWS
jgi:hypothetical protein